MISLLVMALRGCALVVALFSALYFNAFRIEDMLFEVTDQLVNGAKFKSETLERLTKVAADGQLTASGQAGLSMLRYAMVQNAIALNASALIPTDDLPILIERGEADAKAALRSSPTDSFQWFLLFWYATKQGGFDFRALPFLTASYRFGRNEGWIVQRRLFETVTFYPSIGDDLRNAVRNEFQRAVSSGMYFEALSVYERANSGAKMELLTETAKLPEKDRAAFSRYAQRQQFDIAVPGVPETRREWVR